MTEPVINPEFVPEPSKDVLPGISSQSYVLHSDDRALVGAGPFRVWPEGVELAISLRLAPLLSTHSVPSWLTGASDVESLGSNSAIYDPASDSSSAGRPVFNGFEVGVKNESGEPIWCSPHYTGDKNSEFHIRYAGGEGEPRGGTSRWWVSPLPVRGGLFITCRWIAVGLEAPWAAVDLDELAAAAEGAIPASW